MSLIRGNTKWILFLSSSKDSDHRHIWDITYGLYCLESAKINPQDIFLYVDGHDRQFINQIISNGTKNTYTIRESKDFFSDQKNNAHENMVMFITGHGSIAGVDADPPITPYSLLSTIKAAPKLGLAIVYLGQCQAGIFNYVGAGQKKAKDEENPDANVIFVGATNLHNSLSLSTKETFLNGDASWVANLFLLYVFKWISSPADVDGDGKCTIMDSYKYAGAMSNQTNKGEKVISFVNSIDLHGKWVSARELHQKDPSISNRLVLEAIQEQYEAELEFRYTHQECWILNAIPAQSIEI